jgi:hypothetical protein
MGLSMVGVGRSTGSRPSAMVDRSPQNCARLPVETPHGTHTHIRHACREAQKKRKKAQKKRKETQAGWTAGVAWGWGCGRGAACQLRQLRGSVRQGSARSGPAVRHSPVEAVLAAQQEGAREEVLRVGRADAAQAQTSIRMAEAPSRLPSAGLRGCDDWKCALPMTSIRTGAYQSQQSCHDQLTCVAEIMMSPFLGVARLDTEPMSCSASERASSV